MEVREGERRGDERGGGGGVVDSDGERSPLSSTAAVDSAGPTPPLRLPLRP